MPFNKTTGLLNHTQKLSKFIVLLNYGILAQYIIMSGDISTNPGPLDFRCPNNNRGISFCQWNVQRLTDSKFEEISASLSTSQRTSSNGLDILIITKTFCNSKIPGSYYKIQGYELYRKDRKEKKGGGIMMFVNEKLWSKHRTELETEHVEALWTEIRPFKSQRSLLIAGVYRPPSSTLEMDTLLEQNIENACLEGKEIIISGDLNIDFLKRESFTKHRVTSGLSLYQYRQVVWIIFGQTTQRE